MRKLICALVMCVVMCGVWGPKCVVCWVESKPQKSIIGSEEITWCPPTPMIVDKTCVDVKKQLVEINNRVPNIETDKYGRIPLPIPPTDPIHDELIQACKNMLCPLCRSDVSFRQAPGQPNVFWLNKKNNNCEIMKCTVSLTSEGCIMTPIGFIRLFQAGNEKFEIAITCNPDHLKAHLEETIDGWTVIKDEDIKDEDIKDENDWQIVDQQKAVEVSCLYHLRTILGESTIHFSNQNALNGIYAHVLGLPAKGIITLNDLISTLEKFRLKSKIDQDNQQTIHHTINLP